MSRPTFELSDSRPDCEVLEAEYQRLLGFPPSHALEGRTRELADSARTWFTTHGRPWIFARLTDDLAATGGHLRVGEMDFFSNQLQDQFAAAGADGAMLVAVSAGPECEAKARELWQEGKPDEYFFMEMYGSAVVEQLITVASGRICAWADQNGLAALPPYSPGYTGWDVSDQIKLWELIHARNGHPLPGDLQVLETGMLRPKKSLLAVVGLTSQLERVRARAKLIPCENCSLPGCQYRRRPYVHALPQIEDVRRLQNRQSDTPNGSESDSTAPDRAPKYSFNTRALRKWSQERLDLKSMPDGSTEAHFRYEGTTCSNLGLPLEFHYRIHLGTSGEGFRVLNASCAPAPGDTGHTRQCEYLNDAVALMGNIASEQPLVGQPLNDVLTWERAANPSGCYCSTDRRTHKWRLVYEVIHFALTQQTQPSGNGQPSPTLR